MAGEGGFILDSVQRATLSPFSAWQQEKREFTHCLEADTLFFLFSLLTKVWRTKPDKPKRMTTAEEKLACCCFIKSSSCCRPPPPLLLAA